MRVKHLRYRCANRAIGVVNDTTTYVYVSEKLYWFAYDLPDLLADSAQNHCARRICNIGYLFDSFLEYYLKLWNAR